MKWIYLRGVYHNIANFDKIKFKDNNLIIYFSGNNTPTIYHILTDRERKVINQILNNDSRTDNK